LRRDAGGVNISREIIIPEVHSARRRGVLFMPERAIFIWRWEKWNTLYYLVQNIPLPSLAEQLQAALGGWDLATTGLGSVCSKWISHWVSGQHVPERSQYARGCFFLSGNKKVLLFIPVGRSVTHWIRFTPARKILRSRGNLLFISPMRGLVSTENLGLCGVPGSGSIAGCTGTD